MFTSESYNNGKEMYKKAWCTCKFFVLIIQPIIIIIIIIIIIQYYFFAVLVAVAVEFKGNVACFTTQYVQTCLATNQVVIASVL